MYLLRLYRPNECPSDYICSVASSSVSDNIREQHILREKIFLREDNMKRTMYGRTLIHWDILPKDKIAGTFRLRMKLRGHIVKDISERTFLPVFASSYPVVILTYCDDRGLNGELLHSVLISIAHIHCSLTIKRHGLWIAETI